MHTGESLDDEKDTLTTTGSDWVLGRYGKITEAPSLSGKTAVFEDNGLAKGIDTGVGYWEISTSFLGNSGVINWNYDYLDPDMSWTGTNMVSFEVAENCLVAPIPPPSNKCFAMADDKAELYSFDLDISTAPTVVPTGKVLNGEGSTYRATDNAVYTFHQPTEGVSEPSDLYKVDLDGTTTLIKSSFMTEQGVGAEFVNYADGSERFIVLLRQWDSRIHIYDASDLSNTTPLSNTPLFFPDGSNATVDSLAINPATGEILVVDDTNDSADYPEIYSVDMTTGQLTLKVVLSVPGIDAESLAFAEDGNLYLENESWATPPEYDNRIFRVDLSTGAITAVEENINTLVTGDIEGMSCTGSKIVTPTPAPGISGTVFKDANTNNVFDSGDSGIANISVWLQLINADGTIDPVKVPANTDALGKYYIDGLADGNYQVHVDTTDTDIPAGHLIGGVNPLLVTIAGVAVAGVDFPFDEAVCTSFNGEVSEVNLPISSQLKTGDKLFVPSKSASSAVGHLRVYTLDVNGVPATTPEWDAADSTKMVDRASKLFSTDASGKIVLLNTLTEIDASIRSYTIGAVLGGVSRGNNLDILTNSLDTSLYLYDTAYRTYYTDTVSTRSKRVLMSSDDGFLYAFNYATGVLEWAWMPRSLTSELTANDSYQSKHLMAGTLNILDLKDSASTYATYVIGSYKHGLGHYVLKLNADGSLGSVVWDEDQSSAFLKSPNNGEMEYFTDANGTVHAAYVLSNSVNTSRVTIRTVSDVNTNVRVDLNYQVTSSPFVMQNYGKGNAPAKKVLYLGTTTGDIHTAALLTDDGAIEDKDTIKAGLEGTLVASMADSPTDAVIYINSSIAAKDNQYYLSAQTPTRLSVLRYNSSDGSWNNAWTSYVSGAGSWSSDSYTADTVVIPSDQGGFAIVPPTTGIQSLAADATITDKAVIVADTIVLPLSVLPASSAACYGKAYYYMYSLSDGTFPKNSFFKTDNTTITSNIALGYGEASQLTISDLLGKDQLVGYGLSDQRVDFTIGLDSPFVIKDPVATGIRGWKEIRN